MTSKIIIATLVVRIINFSRQRSTVFFTLAFPVILVLVFGTIFTRPEHLNFDLPVQDNSASPSSARLLAAFTADQVFNITAVPRDVDPSRYARDHKLTLLLVIPPDFESLQDGQFTARERSIAIPLMYIHDPSSTSVNTKIQLMNLIVAEVNQRASGRPPWVTLVPVSILPSTYRFIEFFVPGIVAMAIMTSALSNVLNINAELRQKGILQKLSTTPITRADWLAASILYQLILAVLSTAAILIVSYLMFGVRLHVGPLLPLIVIVEVITFVGIGTLLAPLAKEAESASAVANAFLFPMMFLSGTFFPVEMMPAFLGSLARLLPLYYVNEALRSAMVFSDMPAALRATAVTAFFAVIIFCTAMIKSRIGQGQV